MGRYESLWMPPGRSGTLKELWGSFRDALGFFGRQPGRYGTLWAIAKTPKFGLEVPPGRSGTLWEPWGRPPERFDTL